MVGDTGLANDLCGPVHRLLTFSHTHHRCFERFVRSLRPQSFEKLAHIRNHWHLPDLAVLCSSLRITPHDDLASDEITIWPGDVGSLSFPESAVGQKANQGSAIS